MHEPDANGLRLEYDSDTPSINCDKKRRWWYLIKHGHLSVRVLGGISFKGNIESMIGCGNIYAARHYTHRKYLPRFDFVTVRLDESLALAQVLNFIEITNGNDHCEIYAYVAWMELEEPKDHKDIAYGRNYALPYFPRFKYEPCNNYSRGKFMCNISLIECSTIMGPAYVVPDFKDFDSSFAKPSSRHRFYCVMRQWTDRSDWVDSVLADENRRHLPNVASTDKINAYIREMSTSRLANNVDTAGGNKNKKNSSSGGERGGGSRGGGGSRRKRRSLVADLYDIDLEVVDEGSSDSSDDEEDDDEDE